MASLCEVEFIRHDEGQVAIVAAAVSRMDGTGIGIQLLLEELKRFVGALPKYWS